MSKNRRLSVVLFFTAIVFLLACQAKAEDVNYWMKLREVLKKGGTGFEPFDRAAEYASSLMSS